MYRTEGANTNPSKTIVLEGFIVYLFKRGANSMAKKFKVFYSWQSDLSGNKTRYFIEECIAQAQKLLSNSISLVTDEATRYCLGSPDIANSIFNKIDGCDLFIADVSIVGEYRQDPRDDNSKIKKTPNPNVLLELGYASAHLSWERCLCLANTERGDISELPFDLNHRRITDITYGENKKVTRGEKIRQIAEIIYSTVLSLEKREVCSKLSKFIDEQTIRSIHFPEWTQALEDEARICDENADRFEFYSQHLQKIGSILNLTSDMLRGILDYPQFESECNDLLNQIDILSKKMDEIDFEEFYYPDPIIERDKETGKYNAYKPGSPEYIEKTKDWEEWDFSGKKAVLAVWKNTRYALNEDEYSELKELFDKYDAMLVSLDAKIQNVNS